MNAQRLTTVTLLLAALRNRLKAEAEALDNLVKDIESSAVADEGLARKRLATLAKAINTKLRPHGFTVKIELARK